MCSENAFCTFVFCEPGSLLELSCEAGPWGAAVFGGAGAGELRGWPEEARSRDRRRNGRGGSSSTAKMQ